jgi:hypothetical protein
VNTVPTDPGIFTVGSDGEGQAAALAAATYALVTTANPAGMRNGATSDTVQVYVTGLGVPVTGVALGTAGCISAAAYEGALGTSVMPNYTQSTLDGVVLQSTVGEFDSTKFPPCIAVSTTIGTEPTATVGGVAAVINYAAFVANTVTGLYQINLVLPSATNTFYTGYTPATPMAGTQLTNLTTPALLPVFITVGGVTSQAGVMIPVTPALAMTITPAFTSGTTYNLAIGHALGSAGQLAVTTIAGANSGSSAGVTYAVTSGALPAGLTLNTASGVISGTPAEDTAGTYNITVTATTGGATPLTGSESFSYYVPGGLFVTIGSVTTSTFGTLNNAIATVTAIGGTAPYNQFAITTPAVAITGLTITTAGVLHTDGTTPSGVYPITVTATDSAGLTGTVTFSFTVNLHVVVSSAAPGSISVSGGSTTAITTLTVTGGSGSYAYTIDASSADTGNAGNQNDLIFSSLTGTSILEVGTAAPSVSAMTIVVDVNDTGSAPAGAAGTAVAPQAQSVTITVTLTP